MKKAERDAGELLELRVFSEMSDAEIEAWRHRLESEWESQEMYRRFAEAEPELAHQRNPGLFWRVFGREFEERGFSREQVDKYFEGRYWVEPS